MRTIGVACLVVVIACGGRQHATPRQQRLVETCFECPDDFECTDNPKDACTPATRGEDCGGICVLPADRTTDAPLEPDAGTDEPIPVVPVAAPQPYFGCGLPSSPEVPYPCGRQAKPIEDKGYESEWDRPDYCGTPGCGHDQSPD